MSPNVKQNEHKQLKRDLENLRLLQILQTYPEALARATKEDWSFLKLLAHLMGAEVGRKSQQALKNRIKRACLPPWKTLGEYDFKFLNRIPKQKILRIFDCHFVAARSNVVFLGNHGTGKTHLLTALGYDACAKGISVRFTGHIDMICKLRAAQLAGTLGKVLRVYTQPSLLLLDELGHLPAEKGATDLLFQVVSARYETGSIAITTNHPFVCWPTILDNNEILASALVHRLMHRGEAVMIHGASHHMNG